MIWREPPTEADRAGAIAAAGGDLVRLYPVEDTTRPAMAGRLEDRPSRRRAVHGHRGRHEPPISSETVERVLRDVVEMCDPDPDEAACGRRSPPQRSRSTASSSSRAGRSGRRAIRMGYAWPSSRRMLRSKAFGGSTRSSLATTLSPATSCSGGARGSSPCSARAEPRVLLRASSRSPRSSRIFDRTADLLERIRASYPLEAGASKAIVTALVERRTISSRSTYPRSTSSGCGRFSATSGRCGSSYPLWDDPRDGSLLPVFSVFRARLPALVGLPAPPWPARRHRRSDRPILRRGRRAGMTADSASRPPSDSAQKRDLGHRPRRWSSS